MLMLGQNQSKQLKYYLTTIHTSQIFRSCPFTLKFFGKYGPPLSSYAILVELEGAAGSATVEGYGLPPKSKISLTFLTKFLKGEIKRRDYSQKNFFEIVPSFHLPLTKMKFFGSPK